MPKRSLPPPPDAIKVPEARTGPEWEAFCAANPLHIAACGKATTTVTEARVSEIIHWFHKGAAYVSVVRKGRAVWGLGKDRMEQLISVADKEMKRTLETDRHEYVSRMIAKIDGGIEGALEDRQYSAAAGLISIVGRWLSLDPSASRGPK